MNQESGESVMKLGVVHLGRVAGKHKYMLCDAADIAFVQEYRLHGQLMHDADGDGACVYAMSERVDGGTGEVVCFHELLWRRHHGEVPQDCFVGHKNKITVDNRVANLELLEYSELEDHSLYRDVAAVETTGPYQAALAQLSIPDEVEQYKGNKGEGEASDFCECHAPPCCHLQWKATNFTCCMRCQRVSYCSTKCMQMDWKRHRQDCRKLRKIRGDAALVDR